MSTQTYIDRYLEGLNDLKNRYNVTKYNEIAPLLNLQPQSIYNYINGKNKPTVDACIKLCEVTGISADWLLLNKGTKFYDEKLSLIDIKKELISINKKIKSLEMK